LKDDDQPKNKSTIEVTTKSLKIVVNELKTTIERTREGVTEQERIDIPYQSQLTVDLVDIILKEELSDLVSYDECLQYHIPMLNAFNLHLSKILKKEIKVCPIT